MSLDLNQDNQKQKFEQVSPGTYPARISQVIDIGRQHETAWINGKAVPQYYEVGDDGKIVKGSDGFAKKTSKESPLPCIQPKVFVTFELPTETINIDGEDKPRWISKDYNVTNKGALVKLVTSLKPDASRISDIVGLPCTVTVGQTDTGNSKVASVAPLMKGVSIVEVSKSVVFDMDNPDTEVFFSLPEFLQNKITSSDGYKKSKLYALVGDAGGENNSEDDSSPF